MIEKSPVPVSMRETNGVKHVSPGKMSWVRAYLCLADTITCCSCAYMCPGSKLSVCSEIKDVDCAAAAAVHSAVEEEKSLR